MSAKHATLRELQTVYGAEDLYDMIEVMTIDVQNRRIAQKREEDKRAAQG